MAVAVGSTHGWSQEPRAFARPVMRTLAVGLVLVATACSASRVESQHPKPETSTTRAAPAAANRVPEPIQHLDIVGTEYKFGVEQKPAGALRPGWTEVRFHNNGGEAHQVMFARVKEGADPAKLAAAGAGDSSGAGAIEFVDMLGGVSYIGPGKETVAMVDLPKGLVLAMCYVPDRHGVAHALTGMTTALNVEGAPASGVPDASPTAPRRRDEDRPPVRGTIALAPDGYRIPRPLRRGWYHVVNTDIGAPGTGLHELALMRLQRSITSAEQRRLLDDIATNATPELKLTALGGLGALSPGFDAYLYLDLQHGHYLAVDFMPDARNPRPHLLDGYVTNFRT